MSGVASGSGERTCRKCTVCPSIVVVNCGYSLSFASWRAPVVLGLPILGQLLQIIRSARRDSTLAGRFVGPARAGEPLLEIIDRGLRNRDTEREYRGTVGCLVWQLRSR